MKVHPAKVTFLRRYPAPPPTPPGMVSYGGQLRRAKDVQESAARNMAAHDAKLAAGIRLRNRNSHG